VQVKEKRRCKVLLNDNFSISQARRKPMIDATIMMTVPPEKRKEVLQTLTAILGPIRREHGCIRCNCYVDVEAENNIYFRAEWKNSEDLDTHLRSALFGVLIGAMKLLKIEPDIWFNTISSTTGAEEISAARAL
jgi:quinol monooxygenase YgiN